MLAPIYKDNNGLSVVIIYIDLCIFFLLSLKPSSLSSIKILLATAFVMCYVPSCPVTDLFLYSHRSPFVTTTVMGLREPTITIACFLERMISSWPLIFLDAILVLCHDIAEHPSCTRRTCTLIAISRRLKNFLGSRNPLTFFTCLLNSVSDQN